jgi:hypothetical protein
MQERAYRRVRSFYTSFDRRDRFLPGFAAAQRGQGLSAALLDPAQALGFDAICEMLQRVVFQNAAVLASRTGHLGEFPKLKLILSLDPKASVSHDNRPPRPLYLSDAQRFHLAGAFKKLKLPFWTYAA